MVKTEKIPEGYRATEAGILPIDWQVKRLSEVATELTERAGQDKYETVSISAGIGFVNQAEKFGKELSGKQYEKYIVLHQGDFSYNKGNSRTSPQGCIYRLNDRETAAVPNVFESFRIEGQNADYYEQLFLSGFLNKQLYSKINRGVRDDGLLNLTGKDFYSCIVPVPPIAEQKKIAEILAQCDKVIALKQERLEAEIVRKKWLINQLLHHPENYRVPGYGGDWKTSTIGSVTSSFSGGTPTSSNSSYYSDTGIPFIRSGEISSSTTELYLSDQGFVNSAAKMVEKGDLLYALYGANSGECFVSKMNGAINQAILCIRSDTVDVRFLNYILASMKDWIVATFLQGGQGNLSGAIIKKLKIAYPQKEEQQAIVKIIHSQDIVIDKIREELKEFEERRKALMQLLLTGIVRVKL